MKYKGAVLVVGIVLLFLFFPYPRTQTVLIRDCEGQQCFSPSDVVLPKKLVEQKYIVMGIPFAWNFEQETYQNERVFKILFDMGVGISFGLVTITLTSVLGRGSKK